VFINRYLAPAYSPISDITASGLYIANIYPGAQQKSSNPEMQRVFIIIEHKNQ
jgi:hypothetical protein